MQKYQDVVLNQNGNPVSGVQVTVTDLLGTPVSVYSSNAIGLNVNPLTSDNNGRFSFYAPDGRYSLSFSFGGNVVASITDILLEDPMDGSDAVFNDVTILGELSDASKVTSAAVGGISATNVQDALSELDSDKASNADLSLKVNSADLAATGGSALVAFQQSGAGAVARTVQDELRETVSVKQFGVIGDGSDEYTKIKAAWDYCLANGKDLHFPAGIYSSGINNMPMGRVNGLPPTSLLDCKNITIYGDGPTTILRSDSVNGADVLQLNGAKNLHIRNLAVKAAISGSASGSNGVSVTGGYDNITLENVWAEDLPSVDKTTYIDGGKALSIQTPVSGQTVTCGKLKATNIYAKGCVYGFGLEVDLLAASTMPTSVEVDVVAENCREAVIISAGEATSAIPASWTMGVKVRAQAINCMMDVVLARAHGVDVECQVITTKTDAARILNQQGVKWLASDTIASVEGLLCAYAHKSSVVIYGNKGNCSYKARVGAATAGASGLTAATWQSQISVSLAGTASTADFGAVDSGGNVTSECTLVTAGATSAPVSDHYLPSRNNVIVFGNAQSLKDVIVQGAVKFPYTDGLTTFGGEVGFDAEGITVKQKSSGSVDARVLKVLNNAGATKFIVRNDGAFGSAGRYTASAVATVKGVMPIYDESNTLYGYVPVYTSYTP